MFSVTWVTRGDFPGPELDTSVVFFCYVWTPALAEWGWVLPRNERDGGGPLVTASQEHDEDH
jgi:hypothetical protein